MEKYLLLVIFLSTSEPISAEFFDWDYEISLQDKSWTPVLVGEPNILISKDISPHPNVTNMESNNNIAGVFHNERVYLAWRTAPLHFAGKDTRIHMVSSVDFGETWDFEATIFLGTDLREPMFLSLNGHLYFSFFQAGTNPVDFEPLGLWRMKQLRVGEWTEPELYGHEGEVVWEIIKENGTAYSQSYSGQYGLPGDGTDLGQLNMFLNKSQDGITWEPVGSNNSTYFGGLTEVGFYFDLSGNIWGVARNEDGDESGWGSRTFFASHDDLSVWNFVEDESNPWIYESPKMFRHGSELYLVARTDPDGPFWSKDNPILNILPAWEHHLADLASFSLRQHGTGIWHLDRETGLLIPVLELTGCGDTAFPSIIRLSLHQYLILNYSSPPDDCPPNWIAGQTSPKGSIIYSQIIEFV